MYMEFEEDLLDRIKKITKCSYYAKANLVNYEYITTIIEDLIYGSTSTASLKKSYKYNKFYI